MKIIDPVTLATPTEKKRVVIVGGGYAGMTIAVTLAHRKTAADGIEVVFVEARPYQEALSELDLVAAGVPRPQFAELWHADIFRGLDIDCAYDRLECVHPERHTLTLGPRGCPRCEIAYWRLVLATGAIASTPPVPGLAENAVTMWSISDAEELQRRVNARFKEAGMMHDAAERANTLSFTVVGGGATGVEIVGTMAAELPRMMRLAGMDPSDLHLRLIEGRSDILYDLPDVQRTKARRRLEKMGVDLVLGEKLTRVEHDAAFLESGRRVPSAVLVWCGGAHADPDAVEWGLKFGN
jgi:NADH dehydrogenase